MPGDVLPAIACAVDHGICWRLRGSWLVGRRMTVGDLPRCGEGSFREDALSAHTFWRCCGRVRERTSVRAGRQGRVRGREETLGENTLESPAGQAGEKPVEFELQ